MKAQLLVVLLLRSTHARLGSRLRARLVGGPRKGLAAAAVGEAPPSGAAAPSGASLRAANAATVSETLALLDERDARWAPVVKKGRVRVWRLRAADNAGSRHACVLAKGVVDAPPDAVYALFADAARAREFNEFCVECVDVATLDAATKISWSRTKAFGPFKPRDFVTLCHFAPLPGGARGIFNRAATHASKPPRPDYERGEVVLAANVVEAAAGGRTRLTLLTQINPRGAIDSGVGAAISNALVARSPVAFFDAIEKAATATRK